VKAERAHDINGVMEIYAPEVVAYDYSPPLQYVGKEAYRKDYEELFSQFDGPINIEFPDLKVVAGDTVGYAYALEHIKGTMKNGQKIDLWGRCTSGFRKINGKWLDTHDHCSVPADLDTSKAALDLKP
jgi:ketosteroid isomerase-like protein